MAAKKKAPAQIGPEILYPAHSPTFTSGGGISVRVRRSDGSDRRSENFEDIIAETEAWARYVLKRAGIEPHGVPASMEDTGENYAQRFIAGICSIRGKISSGDTSGAAAEAIELGQFMREAELKFKWEHPALVGMDYAERARKAATFKTEDRELRITQCAELYNQLKATHGSEIYEHIGVKIGVKGRALDDYLAECRRRGLIPKRHTRGS